MVSLKTKIFITLLLLISAITILVAFRPQKQDKANNPYVPPVALAQPSKITEVTSPDGKMTLSLKEEKNKDSTIYTFSSTNLNFTKTVPVGITISIPLNTFSPDNKYVFIKESNGNNSNYYTFHLAEASSEGGPISLSDLFSVKHPEYKITEATGWGGINLIVFNTDKKEGGVGPSFWFDVPSKSFIQLSNRFD